MTTLDEFAAEAGGRKKRKCKTCNLPDDLLAQVETARARPEPPTYTLIADWLQAEHHDVSMFNLRNHFQAGHQRDER